MAPITHLVLLQFKEDVSPDIVNEAASRLLGLKENCMHPTSSKPYIVSVKGGRDNSSEGFQGGLTHSFVMEFDNEADRDYYTKEDPVHRDYVNFLKPLLVKIVVSDFTAGVF